MTPHHWPPMMMPHHCRCHHHLVIDDNNNDNDRPTSTMLTATSPPPPPPVSSMTTATSPPPMCQMPPTSHIECHCHRVTTEQKQQEVGKVGKDGKWGEKVKKRRGGMTTARCHSPEFLLTTGEGNNDRDGMCNPRTTPFPLVYPPSMGGSHLSGNDDRAAYHPHATPHLNFIYPPLLGGFFHASLTTTGVACNPHAAPLYFFFCFPLFRGASVPWATRRHVTHMLPSFHFVPPPIVWEGVTYLSPCRSGGSFQITMGQCITHMLPPCLTSFTPPFWQYFTMPPHSTWNPHGICFTTKPCTY